MHYRFPIAQLSKFVFRLFFLMVLFGVNVLPGSAKQDQEQASLDQFDMLTTDSGWVLLGRQLFWTSDAGQSWEEIGPSLPSGGLIRDVEFIDSESGWTLWTTPLPDGSSAFQLSHTADRGRTWATRPLSLFEPGEIASYAEQADMSWFDAQMGWITVKQESGSNFSLGTLFTTSDGGSSWTRSALPVADDVYFSDPQTGWASGGPTGDQLFMTRDAGATWRDARPAGIPETAGSTVYPPAASAGQGLLVTTMLGNENSLDVYSLATASGETSPVERVKLDAQPGLVSLSILDPQNFVAAIPGTNTIVRMADGETDTLENQDGLSASILELDMVSLDAGWARWVDSSCKTLTSNPAACTTTVRLLRTSDGGVTWSEIHLPLVQADAVSPPEEVIQEQAPSSGEALNLGNTNALIGQGFDKCEIPTLTQMQTWANASPYQAVNLYIGGSSRACDNLILNPVFLSRLYKQGWKFIPTWVGPQAPCTGFSSRMSNDPATAYSQGVTQANLAVEQLSALGLTYPDKTGSVVYYDIEHYGSSNAECRAAVKSFMNGWVSRIRARGSLAGVYGSTLCNTGIHDFMSITNVPDVIWPARWYHNIGEGFYDPTANVWGLGSCIPNTAWANHQRIRQYEGDHFETWGGLTLGIDSDVLDGVVAIPYTTPVQVDVAGNNRGVYPMVSDESYRQSYTGLNDGPVKVSNPDRDILTSQSVVYGGVSYSEMMGLPAEQLSKEYLFPYYNNAAMQSQLRVGNLGSQSTTIKVYLGRQEIDSFTLGAGAADRKSYPNANSGPLRVTSSATNILPTIRVLYGSRSYSELMGYPVEGLSKEYWYPVYDNVNASSQLRVSNVGTSSTTVKIYLGGQEIDSYELQAGQASRKTYTGKNNGPLRVVSSVAPILSTIRLLKGTSLSEITGLPLEQLSQESWVPVYNNAGIGSELRVANAGPGSTTISVYVEGVKIDTFQLQSAQSVRKTYSRNAGPLSVVSSVTPVVCSVRMLYSTASFTSLYELMGLPGSQLSRQYFFPWYNNEAMQSEIRLAVP